MNIVTKELSRLARVPLNGHFLALGVEDRRLRFGVALPDQGVRDYVSSIDFDRDVVFGVFDDELHLSGVGHLARGEGFAELGVSVLPEYRGKGLGAALLSRAHMHARNWGVHALFMHCLTENSAIMHLARKQGMDIVAQTGEANAWLTLPPADATSYMSEVFAQRAAVFDYVLKTQLAGARRFTGAMTRRVD